MTQDLDLELDLAGPGPGDLRAVTFPLGKLQADELGAAAVSLCTSIANSDVPLSARSTIEPHGVLFEAPGRLVVALGVAGRLRLAGGTSDTEAARAVSRRLAEIPCKDPVRRPGSSVIAAGALAFDPSAPGELVIPEVAFVRDEDGASWITVVGAESLEIPDLSLYAARAGSRSADTAAGVCIVDSGEAAFVDGVRTALRHIETGRLQKVVLARRVILDFASHVDVTATVAALRRREQSSTIFCVASPGHSFVGASPELLVARDGPVVRSVPLAGTVPMTGDAATDQTAVARLVASTKENLEHRLVVDAVAAQLAARCRTLRVPDDPDVLWLRQIAHLATSISGRLDGEPAAWPSALELAAALHPTPAVGGSPRAEALEMIALLEPQGRGLYAGPVGWVDAGGNGQFVIGIRSSEVTRNSASVHAGAGIVAGSDPSDELAETSFKLDTMLGALTTG
ncbi:MAG: isochorismate synthase MenF [Acidimicrobiales bacterium]